jgi:cyclopropane fatty-acyl-phospholipid synthase-like methyltransferase
VQRNGVTFELDLTESIDRALHDQGCFEPTTTAALAQLTKPGMTVLDLGANIGAHALFLARHVGP